MDNSGIDPDYPGRYSGNGETLLLNIQGLTTTIIKAGGK
jgi:hypothetical protein